MGLEGFSSIQSIVYHHFLPPRVKLTEDLGPAKPEYVDFGPIRHRAFKTAQTPLGPDPVSARIPLLGNSDVILGISHAKDSMDHFYRNSQAYETWWVHEGSGTLKSQFGNLPFRKGDYIVIPFGTTWQMQLNEECKFFTIENPSQIEAPKRYRNSYGQLLEHAPYNERDIRVPEELETHTERGEFDLRIKVRDRLSRHVLDHHPFDVIGWDGYLYPWIFNIEDFERIWWRGNGGSYSGDVIIGEIEASDWRRIYEIAQKSHNQLNIIPIKNYIKQQIEWSLKHGEEERKRKFIDPSSY